VVDHLHHYDVVNVGYEVLVHPSSFAWFEVNDIRVVVDHDSYALDHQVMNYDCYSYYLRETKKKRKIS
jgi:hypothetical protein